ncbi:hypothetical protein IAT40_006863 [Kwoniella sp. CBS 6097]
MRRSISPRPSTSSGLERPISSSSYRLSLSQSTTPPRTPSPPPPASPYGLNANNRVHRKPSLLPSIKIDDNDHHFSEDEQSRRSPGVKKQSSDGVKRMKSIERTRSWAEEVERNRRRHERRREQDRQAALKVKEGPYGQAFWSVSTEVIDSLVEALNPSSSDLSHLPSAASVISANQRRSYRMDSDSSPSVSDQETRPSYRSDKHRDRRGSSAQLEVAQPSARSRKRSDASRRSSPASLMPGLPLPASPISPLDPIPPLKGSPLKSSFHESHKPPAPIPSDQLSPLSTTSPRSVMSIDDIIAKHSPRVMRAVDAVKERARKEIGVDNIRPKSAKSIERDAAGSASSPTPTKTSERSQRMSVERSEDYQVAERKELSFQPIALQPVVRPVPAPKRSSLPTRSIPPIPSRTNSLPPPRPTTLPTSQPPTPDDTNSLSGESLSQEVKIGQALLDQLEKESNRSSTPSSSKRISFQSPRRGTLVSQSSTPTRSSKLSKRRSMPNSDAHGEAQAEAHSHAVYLRSKHLNRIVTLSQPYAQQELNISLAEVGKPTGQPVVIFLGLGCVRYLIALFDDIARAFNLRLICIDRWGLGKTDQVSPGERTVMAWAYVVERVLDEIGVDEFQMLAHSAGAPYALACALRMGQRVRGKIHLLAPWVGADIDGGYRWLKWVPNGVIKGATAAEWKLQSYLLGKPPPLSYKPISHDARAPISSGQKTPTTPLSEDDQSVVPPKNRQDSMAMRASSPHKTGGLVRRASKISAPRSIDHLFTSMPPVTPSGGNNIAPRPHSYVPSKPHGQESADPRISHIGTTSSSQLRPRPDSLHVQSVIPSPRRSEGNLPRRSRPEPETAGEPVEIDPELDIGYILYEGFDLGDPSSASNANDRPSTSASLPVPPSMLSRAQSDLPFPVDGASPAPTGPGFTLALTQASHAECEPGTTSDLFSIVLNRDPRPWGFEYPDIKNKIKIWYGDEDDKISEKSMRWMERSMDDVELIIRKGEGHSLMTSRGTMWEVFESLGKEAKESARTKGSAGERV